MTLPAEVNRVSDQGQGKPFACSSKGPHIFFCRTHFKQLLMQSLLGCLPCEFISWVPLFYCQPSMLDALGIRTSRYGFFLNFMHPLNQQEDLRLDYPCNERKWHQVQLGYLRAFQRGTIGKICCNNVSGPKGRLYT